MARIRTYLTPSGRLHRAEVPAVHRIEHAYVNFYIVEDGPHLTIVDAGHPGSWAVLMHSLGQLDRRPRGLER